MALLRTQEEVDEMRRLIDIVEQYNIEELGGESPYEVVGIGVDKDGAITLKMRRKT